jgi:hypothetical protein
MTKRRWSPLLAAVALIGSACSQPGDGEVVRDPRQVLHAEVASYDLAAGERSRFIVGLFTGDELFVGYGTVDMAFSFLGEGHAADEPVAGPEATGKFLLVPGITKSQVTPGSPVAVPASKGRGVYAADVNFDRPGIWEVQVTADVRGRGELSATAAFQVLDEHRVPAPGEPALKTENPTVRTRDAPKAAVDSRWGKGEEPPDPELHRSTIDSSLRMGHAAVVVFSTPVYCVSRFCGPITDMVQALAHDYSDRADFIHVEIWRNFEKGTINEAAADWLLRDNDLREPWVFLIADGRIQARWDNVATRAEIEPYLERLPSKAE